MNKIVGENLVRDEDRANLLTMLKQAQTKFGYVPEDFIAEVAKSLGVSISEIYGVVTFYSFLSTHSLGRNVIRICRSLPCYLNNCQIIINTMEKEIGIRPGETTLDGRFSFELANCIGLCDRAPAMLINNDAHIDLTPEKISEILQKYK